MAKLRVHSKGVMQETVRAIRRAKRILVACHVNPDGDTIGCQLALGLSLLQMEKKVTLISQDGVPSRFQFLPGSELIVSESDESVDLAIAVDCGSERQLGRAHGIFFKAKMTVQIDHHDFGQPFGKIQLLEEEAAAVGEIVYDLIHALKTEITPAIATCLLTSIIVDTGSFRFTNIRPKTFDVCSKLIKTGVDLRHLIEESYWQKSRSSAKLSGYCASKAQFSRDGKICWSIAQQKDFKRFKAHLSDADTVADDLRSIEGVKIAVVFRETERKSFRVSIRSGDGINVGLIAKRFGGGGHHNSAGCSIPATEKDKTKFLNALAELTGSL